MPTFQWTSNEVLVRRSGQRGFTIIEISVVLVVLVLMATLVAPNFVAMKHTRDIYGVESSITRLPVEARNEARKSQLPVSLRVDGDSLVMERVPPAGNGPPISTLPPGTVTQLGGATKTSAAASAGGSPQEVKRVALTNDIRVELARLNGNAIDAASWQWTVYPDGSADTGGIEFSEGSVRKSLILHNDGNTQWITGDLPDTSQESWPAGALLQRG